MNPYIYTFQRQDRWSAVLAVRMESCPAERPGRESEEETLTRHLCRQMDFINTLFHTHPPRTYALRIITRPHPTIFSAGEITLGLLCRVETGDEQSAHHHAASLARELVTLLGGAMPDHQWSIIQDAVAFTALWEPFPAMQAHIQEIRRREAYVNLEIWRPRSRLGFGPDGATPAIADESSSVYFVHQFLPNPTSLARLLRTMLLHEAPLAYQAALGPTELTATEKAELNAAISRCEQAAARKPRTDCDKTSSSAETPLHQSDALSYGLIEQMLRLQDAPFQMQVTLASPVSLPRSLVEAAGVEITRPIANRLVSSGRAASPIEVQGGGYDAVGPASASERRTAGANLRFLEMAPWGHTLAPKGCERLRQLVDASEAAAAFRFPVATVDGVTGLNVRVIRSRPMPREVAMLASRKTGKLQIGYNNCMGQRQPVFLSERDRLQHAYIVGQTGTGKTTLLKTMILEDIEAGRGVAVVDPHGDLHQELLLQIPAHRAKDVVILDPTDTEFPVGLNLLECEGDEDRHFVVRQFRGIIERLLEDQYGRVATDWTGPVFFQHMQMNLLLAMSNPDDPGTLMEFFNIFHSKGYWKRWLPLRWSDSRLRSWVEKSLPSVDYLKRGSDNSPTWGEYLSSKFEDFVFDPKLRLIFGQKRSTIRIREIMDQGKILLVNLSKGQLAEPNARFLGMLLLAKIQAAAMARSKIPQAKRRLFFLYVDEFQSMATESFVLMLSEARKFGVTLTLANQFLSQISDKRIQQAISGNVGTQVCFRVGREDAEMIEPQFTPFFDKFDLANLPNRNAFVRTTVDGQSVTPFTLETMLPQSAASETAAREVVKASQQKYGRPKAEIERELESSLKDGLDAFSLLIHQVHRDANQSIRDCCQLLELVPPNSITTGSRTKKREEDEKGPTLEEVVQSWLENRSSLEKLITTTAKSGGQEGHRLDALPGLNCSLKAFQKKDAALSQRLRVRTGVEISVEDVLAKIQSNDVRLRLAKHIIGKDFAQPLPKDSGS